MENLSFFKKIYNRFFYFFFIEQFNGKIDFKFPVNIYRWHFIQSIINKKKFKNYLEIGCDDNQTFSKIKIKNKIGVDPISGGTIRKTSDNFFKKNCKKFDIIFIDGLHHYDQVITDIDNSLKVLNEGGCILVHDCLPSSLSEQAVPRYKSRWCGDVWKAIVYYKFNNKLDIFTCRIDLGVSVIRYKKNIPIEHKINLSNSDLKEKIKKLKFSYFYNNYKKLMNLKNYKNALRYL